MQHPFAGLLPVQTTSQLELNDLEQVVAGKNKGGRVQPTTRMLGEEGSGRPPGTTRMLGEEGSGRPPATTLALGEEG